MPNTIKLSIFCAMLTLAGPTRAENVEIYLLDMLDNKQNGYCIDIAGGT